MWLLLLKLLLLFSQANSVAETKRVAAFAVLSGVICGSNVCGTLAAGLLSTPHIFQVAALFSILAAVYMTIFLKDSHTTHENDKLEPPFLNPITENCQPAEAGSSRTMELVHQISSPKQLILLLRSSTIFAVAASVCFFKSLGKAGAGAFLVYFLKARFHFNKDNFALLFVIANLGATFTNALLLPLLGPFIGEEILLSFGLFNGFLSERMQMLLKKYIEEGIPFSVDDICDEVLGTRSGCIKELGYGPKPTRSTSATSSAINELKEKLRQSQVENDQLKEKLDDEIKKGQRREKMLAKHEMLFRRLLGPEYEDEMNEEE